MIQKEGSADKMVTIKEVAKDAGVVISTVSNVLNGQQNISEEIRIRVLASSKKLKYKPNLNAKLLRSGTNKIIGVFLASLQGEFYASFIQSIQKRCSDAGYILQIFIIADNNQQETMNIMTAFGLSGAIVFDEFVTNDMIKRLAYTNIPMVLCDRTYADFLVSSITIDNYGISCMIMEHLIENGHKSIGYIQGTDAYDNRLRYQAYEDTMKKYELEIQEELILKGEYNGMIAHDLVCQLMEEHKKFPDAFYCANDQMAIGCIGALKKYGVEVPKDMSIIGFDNDSAAQYYQPKLSTVSVPSVELGIRSVEEVLRLIALEKIEMGLEVVLTAQFIERDSVQLREVLE
ncbi:MAG: LacI family DNA-binding transcriptional regulator [Eubacteriales bacterium]